MPGLLATFSRVCKFAKKLLAFGEQTLIFQPSQFGNGLVAQLVERLNGIEEVVSSILIESTKLAG